MSLIQPALFDRKFTNIFLRDGFGGVGEIDDSMIAAGDTKLEIDPDETEVTDNATRIPVGARFTLEGETTIYTVVGELSNQTYTLTISMASGGNYDLEIEGVAVDNIAHNADATAIALAINTALGAGSVAVTGSGPFVIEFIGNGYEKRAVEAVIDDSDLEGGGSESGTLVEEFEGGITRELEFSPPLTLAELPTTGDEITFLPQQMEIEVGEGNVSWTETKDREYRLNRGRLNTVRNLDEQPLEINFEFDWRVIRTGTNEVISVPDAIKGIGGAAEWYPSSGNPCEDYCVDLVFVYRPQCGSAVDEIIEFPQFRHDDMSFDMEAASISVTGRCNVEEPVIRREEWTEGGEL